MFGYTVAKRTEPGLKVALIRGLNPAFDYRIKVAAQTEAGMGRFSDPIQITMSSWVDGGVPATTGNLESALQYGERPAAFVDRRLALRDEVKEKAKKIAAYPKAKEPSQRRASIRRDRSNEQAGAIRRSSTRASQDGAETDEGSDDAIAALEEGSCGCENGCSGFMVWMLDSIIHALHNSVDRILYPKSIVDYSKFSNAMSLIFEAVATGPKRLDDQQSSPEEGGVEAGAGTGEKEEPTGGCCSCCGHATVDSNQDDGMTDTTVGDAGPAWWSWMVCGMCGTGEAVPDQLSPEEEEVGAEASDDEEDSLAWQVWMDSNRDKLEDLRLAARESMALGTTGTTPTGSSARGGAGREREVSDADRAEDEEGRLAAHSVFSDARGRGMSGADAEMLSFGGGRPRAPTIADVRRLSIRSYASASTG